MSATNKKKSNLQPEQNKSYIEIINEQLKLAEEDPKFKEKIFQTSVLDDYKIYEDLKIISLAAHDDSDGLGPVFWKDLEKNKILNRQSDCMKNRYKNYLQHMKKEDFDMISFYIQQSNLWGQLVFQKIQGPNSSLEKILDESACKEKSNKSVTKYQIDKHMFSEQINDNTLKLSTAFQKLRPNYDDDCEYENMEINVIENQRIVKKVKLDKTIKTTSKNDMQQEKRIIESLSKTLKIPAEEVLSKIEQCNGDIEDLIKALESGDQSILWTEQDDKNLMKCKNKNDKIFKDLLNKKGKDRILERIRFKELKLSFKF